MASWPRYFDGSVSVPYRQQVDNVTVTNANGQATTAFVTRGGDWLLCGFGVQSSGSFIFRTNAQWEGQYLDTGYVESQSFFSSTPASYPTWVRPKFIPASSTLAFQLQDTSGNPGNLIQITLYGRDAQPGDAKAYGKGRGLMLYTLDAYNAGMPIPSGGTLQQSVSVESGYHFRWDALTGSIGSTNALANMQFRDVRKSFIQYLSNGYMPVPTFLGTANLPMVNESPFVLRSQSAINFLMIDQAAAGVNTFRPLLVGERVPVSDYPGA